MAATGATPLLNGLLDDIVLWEILVCLDPKSLLRCRAVRRAWRCATSTRRFLLAHHARQPALPIFSGVGFRNILAFDHRATADAQLRSVARLDEAYVQEASCDGLLVLARYDWSGSRTRLTVCNPTTRERASLGTLRDFNILGMYPHRPTGEYRLLLQGRSHMDLCSDQDGIYVFALGSDQPPRYIGWSETELASLSFNAPVRVRDSLHWHAEYYVEDEAESGPPEYYNTESELVIVFDTIAESFRQMSAPPVPTKSWSTFEMDDILGIYSCNKATEIVDIWVLRNYETEVWDLKCRVKLPMAEIRGKLEDHDGDRYWYATVASSDGDMLLLVRFGHWLFYVNTDGELVASFQDFYACKHRLKQTLVPHDFFTTLEGYAVDASPFI